MKTTAVDGKRQSVKLEAPPSTGGAPNQATRPPDGQPSSSVQPSSTLYNSGDVVHITRYRRQRNVQRGGPAINLDQGVVKERKFTDPIFIAFFVLNIAAMVGCNIQYQAINIVRTNCIFHLPIGLLLFRSFTIRGKLAMN